MLVLDVGCGLGSDTRRLASMVGSRGYAVGVDVNRALLSEARARSLGNRGPSFVLADASALPFGNDVFDRCRCERVLEHINDGLAAVTEITRVLKKGGRLVVLEPDWDTTIVNGADKDITRRITRAWCDSTTNGWIGRQLPALFRESGLAEISIEALIDFDTAPGSRSARELPNWALEGAAVRAQAVGAITAEESERWLSQLNHAVRSGSFLIGVVYFVVSGRKL